MNSKPTGKKYHARCYDCYESVDTDHKAIADEFVRVHKEELKHVAKVLKIKKD